MEVCNLKQIKIQRALQMERDSLHQMQCAALVNLSIVSQDMIVIERETQILISTAGAEAHDDLCLLQLFILLDLTPTL